MEPNIAGSRHPRCSRHYTFTGETHATSGTFKTHHIAFAAIRQFGMNRLGGLAEFGMNRLGGLLQFGMNRFGGMM